LAQHLRVSAATVSAVENGKTGISVTRLQQYAQALGVTPAQILEGTIGVPATRSARTRCAEDPGFPGRDWRTFPPLVLDGVLSAAIDAFVDTGYHGSTMRDVASRAGMSVPGIYHHYPDKQTLLVAILDATMTELHWRVDAARTDASTGIDEVRRIVEALALFHTHRQKLAFIGASEMRSLTPVNRQRVAESRNRVQHILDGAIDRASKDGVGGAETVLADAAERRIAGRAIATMCTSLPQWFNAAGPATPEETAHVYAEFAVSLLTKQNVNRVG
jgi:AcrR family transcriptional regulator